MEKTPTPTTATLTSSIMLSESSKGSSSSGRKRKGNASPRCVGPEQKVLQAVNELIANLDHELWEVKIRALKCVLEKIECSIVTTDYLSLRVDLLHRLSDWIRTALLVTADNGNSSVRTSGEEQRDADISQVNEGLYYVLKLLILLVAHDDVREFIVNKKLDSDLLRLQSVIDGKSRELLEELFVKMDTSSFAFHWKGSPEVWNDEASNRSLRKTTTSTDKSFSYDDRADDYGGTGDIMRKVDTFDNTMSSNSGKGDGLYSNPSASSVGKPIGENLKFRIPHVQLTGTDRRILASTVESLLSKNDALVLSTSCFFRDVLLRDFPPEVFIQESALCMAFLEVAESPWNVKSISEIATDGLLLLCSLLRNRFVQINNSDFFESKRQVKGAGDSGPYSSSFSAYSTFSRSSPPMADSFVGTLCQVMKSLSRTLLFHPKEFHLWKLLDQFALTLFKYASIFPTDFKALSLGIQEILMDLSYCYEKFGEDINSAVFALCLSSFLKSLNSSGDEFVLPYDVRQCIKKLSNCSLLQTGWPEVHQFLLKYASPFVDNLATPSEKQRQDSSDQQQSQPISAVTQLLIAIQNSTSHQNVYSSIDNLWGYLYPLSMNARTSDLSLDHICNSVPWRDSFYRFLCVEPTCPEDEDLLVSVQDLISFVLSTVGGDTRSNLEEWIVPLCMEKGCALIRLMSTHCLKKDTENMGTILPNVLRSLFEFYTTLVRKCWNPAFSVYKWNLFHSLALIFHKLGDQGFSRCAVIVNPIMEIVSTLVSSLEIKTQLSANPKFSAAMVLRINDFIISLQEKSKGGNTNGFRNNGVIYSSSLSLHHLLILSANSEDEMSRECVGTCCAVIPCLWDCRDFKIRALGYQVAEVISRSVNGVVALMTVLENPNVVWINCYETLIDEEQPAVVKQWAAATLCNLLTKWEDVENSRMELSLPPWTVFDDLAKLLSHAYWFPTLSEVFTSRTAGDVDCYSFTDEGLTNPQLTTTKVLAQICRFLMKIQETNIAELHPASFSDLVCTSGLCAILFRLVGTHNLCPSLHFDQWMSTCAALSCAVEALVSLCNLERGISVILIGDRQSMVYLMQLFTVESPEVELHKTVDDMLTTLKVNVLTLLTAVCQDSGNNFEDFQRCVAGQRSIIFQVLSEWLKSDALVACRKIALSFTFAFLSNLNRADPENTSLNKTTGHLLLCREWKSKGGTYGSCIGSCLLEIYSESNIQEEKIDSLKMLSLLFGLSPSAKAHLIEVNVVRKLLTVVQEYAQKYCDTSDAYLPGRKSQGNPAWLNELLLILSTLSGLVYNFLPGRQRAHDLGIVDALHKVFRWWKVYNDRSLLHGFLEFFLNLTEEFPQGSQSLTFTTNILGVGPKKAPTPQSLFSEILDILNAELNGMESCTLKTVELIFELLKNSAYVTECRTILQKSPVLLFLTNLYTRDIKKWTAKQHRIKTLFLSFLLHISSFPDMQLAIAKITESIEIIVMLINEADPSTSLLSLQLLRNLSFHPSNKTRLLCDDLVIPCFSSKLINSEDPKVIEAAGVGLWALISNCEKGKITAKRTLSSLTMTKVIGRLRKLEQASNDLLLEKRDLTNLINIVTTLSNILGPCPTSQAS